MLKSLVVVWKSSLLISRTTLSSTSCWKSSPCHILVFLFLVVEEGELRDHYVVEIVVLGCRFGWAGNLYVNWIRDSQPHSFLIFEGRCVTFPGDTYRNGCLPYIGHAQTRERIPPRSNLVNNFLLELLIAAYVTPREVPYQEIPSQCGWQLTRTMPLMRPHYLYQTRLSLHCPGPFIDRTPGQDIL